MAAATPANSATTFARSTKNPVTITKNVERKPNSSRIRSESPFPVTTPIRAHISSVTYSAIVIGISDHSSVYPYCAPAWVYTEIPPASLSTLEVISPGPTTASSSVKRRRRPRIFLRKSVSPARMRSNFSEISRQFIAPPAFPSYAFTSFDTTSSTVIAPIGRFSSSITVSMRRLYLSKSSNTSLSSAFADTLSSGSSLSSIMR